MAFVDFSLPRELIAQPPAQPRHPSRLMVLLRDTGQMEHRYFYDLPGYLREGDVLVLNDTRVLPARLLGHKKETGGRVEGLRLKAEGGGPGPPPPLHPPPPPGPRPLPGGLRPEPRAPGRPDAGAPLHPGAPGEAT